MFVDLERRQILAVPVVRELASGKLTSEVAREFELTMWDVNRVIKTAKQEHGCKTLPQLVATMVKKNLL